MIKHRISNTECRMSKGCVLPLAYPIIVCAVLLGQDRIQVSKQSKTSSMFQPGLSQSLAWQGLRGLGEDRMKHAGPGREAMKCAMT
jgi:hypothetical protein